MAGYEFDVFRPPERRIETIVEVRSASSPATLRGKVADIDDKPLQATLRFPSAPGELGSKVYDASPEFEVRLPPGEYHVEVQAEGHLVRGRTLLIKSGETVVADFLLRPTPQVMSAQLTPKRIEITQRVQFGFNEAKVLPASFSLLDQVVDILFRNPRVKVRIEGHTDEVGTAEYNLSLSKSRARAVMDYLREAGISARRLHAEGFGLTRPIASNRTEEDRARNRRVQFEIVEVDKDNDPKPAIPPLTPRPAALQMAPEPSPEPAAVASLSEVAEKKEAEAWWADAGLTERAARSASLRTWAKVATGIAAGAAVGASLFGLSALRAYEGRPVDAEVRHVAVGRAGWANGLWAVAAASGAATLVLVAIDFDLLVPAAPAAASREEVTP